MDINFSKFQEITSEGQGNLACYSPWGHKESDKTQQLKNNNRKYKLWASQVVLVVKNPSANAKDVRDASFIPGSGRSPGGGNSTPLQILARTIPWTEEPGKLQSIGSQGVRRD